MDYSIFSARLRTLMESRGLTANSLSEQSNITPATISRYLNCNRHPTLQYVAAFADFFEVSIDWLIGREENRHAPLPKDIQELIDLYNIALPEDRKVIQTILERYKKEEE